MSFRNITNACRNSFGVVFLLGLSALGVWGFQESSPLSSLQIVEAGRADEKNVPRSLYFLQEGDYEKAMDSLTPDLDPSLSWLKDYYQGLIEVSAPLEKQESPHFILFTPPGQEFLADYALSSLEKVGDTYQKLFGFRPLRKIRVEIYPGKEEFSKASTLSIPILENSGAIGICKFHRLMIMSPQSLPLGYRWLDALSHEYAHLMINEMSDSRMELWLHEGTARYLETIYRSDPPLYLTPHQKTDLKKALEEKRLIPFQRMSPSLVYLKNQEEVSLAFAQVAHAVSLLIKTQGVKRYGKFLTSLQTKPFAQAFQESFKQSPSEFEADWQSQLEKEPWEKTIGALSDEIRFQNIDESSVIGADAKGRTRLGDRMRMQGLMEAALLEYEKALKEEPDNAVILLKVARTQLALKQKGAAIQNLRKAIEKNPNYITPYIELAGLLEGKEAEKLYLEANAMNPFDPRVKEGLAKKNR